MAAVGGRSGTGRVSRPDRDATVSWSGATRDGMRGPSSYSGSLRDCSVFLLKLIAINEFEVGIPGPYNPKALRPSTLYDDDRNDDHNNDQNDDEQVHPPVLHGLLGRDVVIE